MDTKRILGFAGMYVVCSIACFIAHYLVEYKYYSECRKDLFTVFASTLSPYCHSLKKISGLLEFLPVRVIENGLKTIFAPFISLIKDGFFEAI